MPTYQYVCTDCRERLEAQQSFADQPLTECPVCGGRLRKLFSAVGVVFKGSGFYRTDSRAAEAAPSDGKAADRRDDTGKSDAGKTRGEGRPADTSAAGAKTEGGRATSGKTFPPDGGEPAA